jgi:guanylate kinase
MELDDELQNKVAAYKVSQAALDPIRHAPLLFAVGITGAGKNALLDYLVETYPHDYQFVVSHTTRPMRPYERQDVNYHFVSFPTIEKMLADGEFIEAQVVHYDNVYGTSIAEIARAQEANKIACSDVEIQGVDEYHALGLNARAVFLLPPTFEVWRSRLQARYKEVGHIDKKDLKNRLKSALLEIQHALERDYYYIVINEDLIDSAELVNKIAHGEDVPPHYPKAVAIAENIMAAIRTELDKLEASVTANA